MKSRFWKKEIKTSIDKTGKNSMNEMLTYAINEFTTVFQSVTKKMLS